MPPLDIQVCQGDQAIEHIVQTAEQLNQSGDQLTFSRSLSNTAAGQIQGGD